MPEPSPNPFEDSARATKARRFVGYLIHLGIKAEHVEDWDQEVWQMMTDGLSAYCGSRVNAPSPTTQGIIRNYLVGHEQRERVTRSRAA